MLVAAVSQARSASLIKHRPYTRSRLIRLLIILGCGFANPIGAAELPAHYALEPLPGSEQDQLFRTRAEIAATARRVLAAYADKELAARGFLDVSQAPYLARGDDTSDDTEALQRALKDGRDARLVVWLPAGTYLISDTLQGVEGAVQWRGGTAANAPGGKPPRPALTAADYPCVLAGPRGPRRAVLKLSDQARGFDDPARPKPLLYFWARRWQPPHDRQPNVSFNQVLRNVDLDIRGHAGAIAADMQGAQGTVVQGVHIEAGGAFAGLRGLTGSGGGTAGVSVRGGRFGIFAAGLGETAPLTGSQPAPLLTDVVLEDQSEAAITWSGRGPLTIVGARLRGAGIVCRALEHAYDGALDLVDSSLELAPGDGHAAIVSDRPVYLKNTYVRGTTTVVELAGRAALEAPPGGDWTQIREFAGSPAGPFPIWLEGKRQNGPLIATSVAGPPPADLASPHSLPEIPDWNEAGVTDATLPPYGAAGDNRTDAAPAIQRALDEHDTVFLPKGVYRLSRPLVLGPGQRLFGAGRTFTVLAPLRGAEAFSSPRTPRPLVETVDDPDASVVLARVRLYPDAPGAYALHWRAGGRSAAVCDVNFGGGGRAALERPSVLVEGGAGGRWFDFYNDATLAGGHDGRYLLARGTRRPLRFYMFNIEHARTDVNAEFVDCRDVTIYALKGETHEIGHPETGTRPLLWVRDCAGFQLFGAGGIGGSAAGSPPYVYRFENCRDLLFANAGHQLLPNSMADPRTWSMIVDAWDGGRVATPGDEYFVLYKRK